METLYSETNLLSLLIPISRRPLIQTGNYNQFWNADREIDNRTSLITDPPDGRIPPLTPEAELRQKNQPGRPAKADGPEDRSAEERCITFNVPRTRAGYNSYFQFVQSANTVAILQESIHETRTIPIGTSPHVPATVRQWLGDSRGHWEGDTLVVDTTNFLPEAVLNGATENLHLIERYTRVSEDYLDWEITWIDPATWTKPWTEMIRLKRSDELVYEYACHEGNYALPDILAGARAEEKAAAEAAAKKSQQLAFHKIASRHLASSGRKPEMILILQKLASSLRKIGMLAVAFSLGANTSFFLAKDGIVRAAQSQTPVLRVQVDLQSIAVRVTDKQGNDVRGLSAQDFTILEDGRPQKTAFFGAEKVPTSLSILVDSSSSMDSNRKLGSAEAVAAKFIGSGRAGDEISAMDFTDEFGPFQLLTREQLLNPSSVPLVSGPSQGSALYDAIAMGVCHLQASKNLRKAIVVITDGDDQQSRITLDQLIALLQSSRMQLFTVGWHARPEYRFDGHAEKKLTLVTGHDIDNPSVVFDRLAKEAGAESVFPTSDDGMNLALKKVSDLLEAQYTLAYYPENSSKKFRRIQVKTKRPGFEVTVRRGVGSGSTALEAVNFVAGTCQVSPQLHPYPYEPRVSHDGKGIVYRETFSDLRSGWPNREGSRYAAGGYELSGIEGTKLHLNPAQPNRQPGGYSETVVEQRDVLAAYGPWWDDFRVSAVVDPVMGSSDNVDSENSQSFEKDRPSAGLVFRLSAGGYYAALLSTNRDRKEWWLKLVTRRYEIFTETVIVPWSKVTVPQLSRSGTKLAVETAGSLITIFVDDQEVKRVQDDAFTQGYVGFVLSGAERATFRDLIVEQAP